MAEQGIPLPVGYRWRIGSAWDRPWVRRGLQATLQESFPEQSNWDHLEETLDRLFDPPRTPCWWILKEETAEPVGCVWAGISTDQATHRRVAYIFVGRAWARPSFSRWNDGDPSSSWRPSPCRFIAITRLPSISTSGPISPCKATGCANPSAPLAWQNQKVMKFCK